MLKLIQNLEKLMKSFLIIAITMVLSLFIVPAYAEIVIIEVESNPEGTDSGNEWARLFNSGKESVSLSGWGMNTTHGETKSYRLSGNISACDDKIIIFPGQFVDNENESLILYDDAGKVVDSTSKINDNANTNLTWKTNTPKCEYVPEQISESKPTPEVKPVLEPVESTPETSEESEKKDAPDLGFTFQNNEKLIEDLIPILPYLGIVTAGIIGGIIALAIRNNKKVDKLLKAQENEYNPILENMPMATKFQNKQTRSQAGYEKKIPLEQIIKSKVRMISKLQERKIGNYEKLEAIKKSMIADSSFSKKDNDYLQTKYEEYKKVIKKESEDKTK